MQINKRPKGEHFTYSGAFFFVIRADLLGKVRIGHARSAERVRQRGDSLPTKFVLIKPEQSSDARKNLQDAGS
jgi:hypothetical protein